MPGRDITVTGTATIQSQALGARTLRRLASLSLQPDTSETGTFYFWKEPFDPKSGSIAPIVKEVRRSSAAETVQSILDWRDKNMPYRALAPGSGSTLDRIVAQRCGICHDASYLTASLARANGIPAVVIGVDKLPESGSFVDADTAHGHVRVRLPTLGWISIEPLNRTSLRSFGGSNYLDFAIQSEKDEDERISLQSYRVWGERLR
jgi:transglutaminase-like putative cysteine protease